ncbi:hypothetical protein Cgig2_023151 [Carnegiea gigantea]|uniref:Acyltransferase n=1 Tax=Carnegiea gigantea TaxID=171969 RepID=A0A9Q1KF02_9CARY|nr:hypothetical protein Cgig2_023151 [Carnegiea gigantea]
MAEGTGAFYWLRWSVAGGGAAVVVEWWFRPKGLRRAQWGSAEDGGSRGGGGWWVVVVHDWEVLADILPGDTLLWKLQMMRSAASYVNSRMHAVKAEVLILASGRDPLLPNLEEAKRIRGALPKQEIRVLKSTGKMPKCEIRKFDDCGHFLLLEDEVDLVTILKGASFYRRGRFHDYVNDYLPPTESEFKKVCESLRWIEAATGPVMLSTLENGKLNEDQVDLSAFDTFRLMGAVPVTASNFYKLLSSGSRVLLYPGGMREALHKRGEEYKLIWPERSEFVRMAARFGAKIIPFGVVGEDDICEVESVPLLFLVQAIMCNKQTLHAPFSCHSPSASNTCELVAYFEDQMKIPYLRERVEKGRTQLIRVRPSSPEVPALIISCSSIRPSYSLLHNNYVSL